MPALAPAAQTSQVDNAALLQTMIGTFKNFDDRLTQIQAAQAAAAVKPVPELPTIEDPVLKAAASSAVEAIKMNPAEGGQRARRCMSLQHSHAAVVTSHAAYTAVNIA